MSTARFDIDDPAEAATIAAVIAAYRRGDKIAITSAAEAAKADEVAKAAEDAKPKGKPFVGMTNKRRVEIPDGEPLFKIYYDTPLHAEVKNGFIMWAGEAYDSLTGAAKASGLHVNDGCHAPNGYKWWRVQENGRWVPIDESRFTEPEKNK